MAHIEGLTEDLRQQVAALQQRVAASQWDLEAWKKMAELAHSLRAARRIPEAHLQLQRTIYEDLLMQFPTWVRYWKEYAEGEMEAGQEGRVKAIVSRCLLPCKAADLWQVYLRFVQQMNEPKMPEGMVEVSRAYQYTLEYIGQDFHSGLIWQEYLDFLQAPRPGTPAYLALYGAAAKEQQEGHRAVLIRKAFQQALMVPTAQLDAIWRAYEAFENSTSNKVFADKVLSEQHHHYQAARGLARKRQELLRPLMRDGPAMLPGSRGRAGVELMKAWRTYLEWEVGNPQKLQDQDLLNQRIVLAYDQALMELQHYPEMWHEYCRWYQSSMKDWQRGVEAILHRAQKACPGCLMFHFMEADIAEAQNNLEAAKQLYNALVAPMDADAGKEPGSQAVEVPEEQGGLLWVLFMRFTLRTAGLTQARKVFVRAKKWRKCPWQVYCMAAMMEWYQPSCSDPSVPRRIFERGMEKPGFLAQVGFVSAYVNFLIGCRDTVNARAVLERVLAEEKARQERGIWDLFLQFEREHGSLQAMLAVQERMRAAFPDDFDEGDELQMAITSYQYQEMWPCTMRQQQHLEHVLRSAGDGETEADSHELHDDAASAGAAAGLRITASWEGTLPPALAALLVQLSPASQVVGPVPSADLVMEVVKAADFVALAQRWPGLELSEAALGQKRRMDSQGLDDDLGSMGGSGAATQYDVFRRRRRQKARLM